MGMKRWGGIMPSTGCVQPEKRFETVEISVDGILRLIVDLEAAFLERAAHPDLDFVGLGSGGGNLIRDEEILIAARILCPVHRGVRRPPERLRIGAVVGVNCDSDAGGDLEVVAVHREGLADAGEQLGDHQLGVRRRRESAQEHGELLASGARNGVGGTQACAEALRQFLEAEIADRMAVGVVDLLEAIEVEAYDGSQIAMARSRSQCLLHAILEQQPVREPGKGVVIGLMEEPVVQLLALGNVLRQGETRPAPFEKDAVRSCLGLNPAAIFFHVGPGAGDEGRLGHILQPPLEFQRHLPADVMSRSVMARNSSWV